MGTIDHVVLAARTLEEGCAFVRDRLGHTPAPGGEHPQMGTHNAVLRLGEKLYLEVIAVNPGAPPPGRPRWMALDDPAMQAALRASPRLVCWMATTDDIDAAASRFGSLVGEVWNGERGALRWKLTVRADGALPAGGAVPHLIQWPEGVHPAANMPDAGFAFRSLSVRHRAKAWLDRTLADLRVSGAVETEAARDGEQALELVVERRGRRFVL